MKTIICKDCKKKIEKKSSKGRKLYCEDCALKRRITTFRNSDKKRRLSSHRKEWKEKWKVGYRETKREYDKQRYRSHRKEYLQYSAEYKKTHQEETRMRSYALQFLKQIVFKRANNKCEMCGNTENLRLHHKEYTQSNKKKDREIDAQKILLVCSICHSKIHNSEPTHHKHLGIEVEL